MPRSPTRHSPVAFFFAALLAVLLLVAGGSASAQSAADEFSFDELDDVETQQDDEEEEEEQDEEEDAYDPSEDVDLGEPSPYGDIEELVVTGTASTGSADLAEGDSVVQFGSEDLDAFGATDISDLADFTPNLEIVSPGATAPTLFIRGVGLNDFNANSSSAVSVYQDDVLRNSQGLQLPTFYDVATVNVLRGPQGFGSARNASAGAIKLYSREPTGDFGGFMRADFGNYMYRKIEAAVEAPIVGDLLRMRVAGTYAGRDGFMKNRCGNAPPYSERTPIPVGANPAAPPWSICGEQVSRFNNNPDVPDGISEIPPGLPTYVNDQGFWAMRAILVFEPSDTVRLRLIGQTQSIDQYSPLGQAYGTGGVICLDGDISDNCNIPYPDGSRSQSTLGGTDSLLYQTVEVRERLAQLAPECFPNGLYDVLCPTRNAAYNDAKITVANELAQNLDSRPFEGDFNRVGDTTNDVWGISLKGDFELPANLSLTSVTSFDSYDRLVDIDLDFSPNTLFQIATEDDLWQVYQDFKLSGDLGEYLLGTWDAGAYGLVESLDVQGRNDFGNRSVFGVAGRDYTQDLYSFALYGNASFEFWDSFVLDGGIRYNWDRKTIHYELARAGQLFINDQAKTWQAPTGGVRLTYNFRADTSVYWKYTRGWKGGHYNATSSDVQQVSLADPEENNAFEIGMRGVYFDGLLSMSNTFFYYAYDNYQIFTAQQFLNGQPEFVIINANDAESYGIESELVAEPWEGAFLRFNFGWLQTQFLDFVQEQQTSEPTASGTRIVITKEIQNTGNPLLNSPRFNFTLTGAQKFSFGRFGSITPRYDASWKSDTYFDGTAGRGIPNSQGLQFLPPNTIGQSAYWLHNFRLTYKTETENIEVAFWVRNIADEQYKTFGFDGSTFNQTTIYFVGDPRTLGMSLGVTF